jgi:hypothetical protein
MKHGVSKMGIWHDAWTYRPQPNTNNPAIRNMNLLSFFQKGLLFLVLIIVMISYTITFALYFSVFQYLKNYNTDLYYLSIGAILGWAFSLVGYTINEQNDSPQSRFNTTIRAIMYYFAIFLIIEGCFVIVTFIKI